MFSISIDTDWATQETIDYTAELLDEYNITATFFLTNPINCSKLSNHEIAIHPNFENQIDWEQVIKTTINFLPSKQSKGCRSHKLFRSSTLNPIYEKFGIEYDSNYFLSNYKTPLPFFFPQSNILEIPFFFGDDALLTETCMMDFNTVNLDDSGVKVFLFHPFHIFMNTSSMKEYESLKPYYNSEDLNSHKSIKTNLN